MSHDTVSLRYDAVSLRHDAASLSLRHDAASLRHDEVSLKDDTYSLRDDAMSLRHDATINTANGAAHLLETLNIHDHWAPAISTETGLTWGGAIHLCRHAKKHESMYKEYKTNQLNNICPLTVASIVQRKNKMSSPASESLLPDNLDYQLGAGDAVFSSFVVAPCVVGVWRGTWGIMDLHHQFFPYAQSFIMGIIVHVSFALVRSHLLSRSKGAWGDPPGAAGRWLFERALSRVYLYVFILSNITHWRGGWGLLDATVAAILPEPKDPHSVCTLHGHECFYLFILSNITHWRGGWGLLDATVAALLPEPKDPHRPVLYAAFTIFFYLSTVGLRSSKNILASPYFLVTDGKEPTYIFTTRFKKEFMSLDPRLETSIKR
ncbi:fuseless domain-containing protein [Phthorimaea operculella]|nr:fuseless domain-containing protein [Phthorimaea operculella]